MPRKPKSIRWTIEIAAAEFAINPRTLKGRFTKLGIDHKSGGYTTQQVCEAVYGDIHGERLLKERAIRKQEEMKAEQMAGELVRVDDMRATMEKAFTSLLQRIKGDGNLDEGMKTELVDDLRNGLLAVK